VPSPEIRSRAMRVFPVKRNSFEIHDKNFSRRRVIHRSCGERILRALLASMNNSGIAISPTFQGWVRSTEDPPTPERDDRLQLPGVSVRPDIGHPAFSRPVGTQCNRTFVLPNLQRLGYCQTSLRDKGKILVALGRMPGYTAGENVRGYGIGL
jgi:hypothetical protein